MSKFRNHVLKFIGCGSLYFLTLSCGSHSITSGKIDGFWTPGTETVTRASLKLKKADDNNIPYEVTKITKNIPDPWGSSENIVQTDYEFTFKNISQAQCEKLKQLYSVNGEGDYKFKANIPCQASGTYRLSQFLPPIVQATKSLAFKDELSGVNLVATNCWGTAYEFARLATDGINVFFADDREITRAYSLQATKKLFQYRMTKPSPAAKLFSSPATKQLQTGDLLIISGDGSTPMGTAIQHAAVYIDENLVFQKWAGPEVFTYQINTFDYIFTQYGRGTVHKFIRPLRKFQSPNESVKLSCKTTSMGEKTCGKIVFVPFAKKENGDYGVKLGKVL